MTDGTANLVLEKLRALRADLSALRDGVRVDVREKKACLDRIEINVALLGVEVARRWTVLGPARSTRPLGIER